MFKQIKEINSIDIEQMYEIFYAILVTFYFETVMIELFGLDLKLELNRKKSKK